MGKLRRFLHKLLGASSGGRSDVYMDSPPTLDPVFKGLRNPPDTTQTSSRIPFNTNSKSSVPVGAAVVVAPSREAVPITPKILKTDDNSAASRYPAFQHLPNVTGTRAATTLDSFTTPRNKQLPEIPPQDIRRINDKSHPTPDQDEEIVPVVQTQGSFESKPINNLTSLPMDSNRATPSSNPHTGNFFSNGSGFHFHNPVMQEIHEHHGQSVLDKLRMYIIVGAEFDSSYRDDPPRCHPNTRTRFLEQLQGHVHDGALGTRIIWLVGPAGIGKSAIMQSLAEIVCPLPTLRCATVFFSRPNHRDDPKKVFTTLAYNFAVADGGYRRYMGEKLSVDPGFLEKSLDEQFKRLFVTPFTTEGVDFGTRRWVVFLDGFDEINGEREQCRILNLIRESLLPPAQTTPFIWIIASRPEAHLQTSFHRVEQQIERFWKLEVPIDSAEALRGVESYLRSEFTKIREHYPDVVPSLWPSENGFLQLTKASSGLFIFASTLVDYVGKENPVSRLKHLLSLIGQSTVDRQDSSYDVKRNPFRTLDILYTAIMSDVSVDSLPTTKSILGFYLLSDDVTQTPPNLLFLCNILGLEQHGAYAALRKLHSVLTLPSPDKAHEANVSFLHASFSDFLQERSRSQSYHIDLDQEFVNIWRCYASIIKIAPIKAFSNRIVLSWKPPPTTGNEKLRNLIQEQARYFSLTTMTRFCHDPSCQHAGLQHRLSPNTAELIEVFDKFGSLLFEREALGSFGNDMAYFCGWLFNHAPAAFRQRMILREYDLTQLGEHDLDNMFAGLHARKWASYHLFPGYRWSPPGLFDLKNLSIERWNQTKQLVLNRSKGVSWGTYPLNWSVLANLLILQRSLNVEESRTVRVTILRTAPTNHYAIVGPLHINHSIGDFTGYFVFPYVGLGLERVHVNSIT